MNLVFSASFVCGSSPERAGISERMRENVSDQLKIRSETALHALGDRRNV